MQAEDTKQERNKPWDMSLKRPGFPPGPPHAPGKSPLSHHHSYRYGTPRMLLPTYKASRVGIRGVEQVPYANLQCTYIGRYIGMGPSLYSTLRSRCNPRGTGTRKERPAVILKYE